VQPLVRDPVRVTALATVGFVLSRLLQTPEPGLELRHGALAAALCSLVALSGAFAAASAPLQRRRPAPVAYEAPPAPPVWGSSPPPGP
jgi:hypothetical protein